MILVDFRKYQQDILDCFEAGRQQGHRRFHFVAPPGSGKTLVGLEILSRLGQPAAVFSPTRAIQTQWLHYCRDHGLGITASTDPSSPATLISLTYQVISTKDGNSGEMHSNAQAILEILRQRPILIFDECHHLTREWARIIKDLLASGVKGQKGADFWMIGLTATPPLDREAQAQETYYQLLGDVSLEVPLAPVVKEGYLAPFQDLVYLVSPTDQEQEILERKLASYRALLEKLCTGTELLSLPFWVSERLMSYPGSGGQAWSWEELGRKIPDLARAFARYLFHRAWDFPLEFIPSKEAEEALGFQDVLLILEDYYRDYLGPLSQESPVPGQKEAASEAQEGIRSTLLELGFALGKRGVVRRGEGVADILARSRSKILAIKPILKAESRFMGDEFRCLILCDQEDQGTREGTSALEVLSFLTEDPETDALDPILITGKSVLVDDDILEAFLAAARSFRERHPGNWELQWESRGPFCEISSSSSAWSSRVYVPLITYLLEIGLTRCLVSTKSLLGEGWNSIRLNTLVDLTVTSGYAYVNQMRGRTLRLDPDRPLKTANNWDIVTIHPDREQGFFDLERLERKYSRFFGLTPQGTIEKGMGHLHPLLSRQDLQELFNDRASINRQMLERCQNRLWVHRAWKVGKPYRNTLLHVLDVGLENQGSGGAWMAPQPWRKALEATRNWARGFRNTMAALHLGLWGLLYLTWKVLGESPDYPKIFWEPLQGFAFLLVLTALPLFFPGLPGLLMGFRSWVGAWKNRNARSLLERLTRIVEASARSCPADQDGARPSKVNIRKTGPGHFRIEARDPKWSAFLCRALDEMLCSPGDQKYYLVTTAILDRATVRRLHRELIPRCGLGPDGKRGWDGKIKRDNNRETFLAFWNSRWGFWKGLPRNYLVVPVPEAFSSHKSKAQVFLQVWREHYGDAQLIGQRQKGSREILHSHYRRHPLGFRVQRRELWI